MTNVSPVNETDSEKLPTTRRSFLKTTGALGAASTLGLLAASEPAGAVPLGKNTTFTTLNRNNTGSKLLSGKGGNGTAAAWKNLKQMNAEVEQWPFYQHFNDPRVYDEITWASLGRKFTVSGGGSRRARIKVIGREGGSLYIDSHQNGLTTAKLTMIVRDLTAKTVHRKSIRQHKRNTRGHSVFPLRRYTKTMDVKLVSGHTYAVDVRLESRAKASPSKWNGFVGSYWYDGGRYSSKKGGAYLDKIVVSYA